MGMAGAGIAVLASRFTRACRVESAQKLRVTEMADYLAEAGVASLASKLIRDCDSN